MFYVTLVGKVLQVLLVQYTFYVKKVEISFRKYKVLAKRWIDPSMKEALKYLKFEADE
jgi:hypothetical protein